MKAKKSIRLFTTFMLPLFFLAVYACNNDNATSPDPVSDADYSSSEYAVYEYDDEFAGINDGSLDNDMTLSQDSPRDHQALQANRGRASFMNRRGHRGMHLWQLLDSLNLTVDQDTLVKIILMDYRECITVPIQEFRDEATPIIEEARLQRQAIVDSMRAGVITHREAFTEMMSIFKAKHELIKELADQLGLREAMCECKITMFDNIAAILDETQKAIFDEWYAKQWGPCFTPAPADTTSN
ncbi:MAG: hypothetical protein DWQ10_17110 [Calditrichaeota bacterium]|nr:MAG: hypothetical protein DWQ10_17110 [Calditrichota bacterium]